jgi:membrane-bound ClpP family serine protease
MWLGPNTAFALIVLGFLFLYGEFVWPGKIWPAAAGAAMAVIGAYLLYRRDATAAGLCWAGAAIALFLVDVFLNTFFIAGALGTAALGYASWKLIPGSRPITPAFSIPLCVIFGAVTMLLTNSARQARINKRADL